MLYGIGCDLCEIAHLEKSLTGAHAAAFIRRVYGEAERAALSLDEPLPAGRSAAHRLASAAANFAAKEAFLKAAGTGLRERAGQITPEDQKRVDQALDVSLGLTSY